MHDILNAKAFLSGINFHEKENNWGSAHPDVID